MNSSKLVSYEQRFNNSSISDIYPHLGTSYSDLFFKKLLKFKENIKTKTDNIKSYFQKKRKSCPALSPLTLFFTKKLIKLFPTRLLFISIIVISITFKEKI